LGSMPPFSLGRSLRLLQIPAFVGGVVLGLLIMMAPRTGYVSKGRTLTFLDMTARTRAKLSESVVTKEDLVKTEGPNITRSAYTLSTKEKFISLPNIPSVKRPAEKSLSVPSLHLVPKVHDIIRPFVKDKHYAQQLALRIVKESNENNYDPLFVAAVIKSESGFNALATSQVGAKGLMQIMPATGRYVEKIHDVGPRPAGFLTDPQYNLKLGITYLKHLEDLYEGNRVLTLIAYNWGPGKLDRTMQGKNRGVPRQVMNYALRILHDHNNWHHEFQSAIG
jgi:hypothetical protein